MTSLRPVWMGCALLVSLAATSLAEVTSIVGRVEAVVQEFKAGSPGNVNEVNDEFPGTDNELPLQVLARLDNLDPNGPAAGAAAAQFADPTDLAQPNPEEFALNMTLNSVSPEVSYSGEALSQETRGVRFEPGDFLGAEEGETVDVTGRLFLDGALALLAVGEDQDLSGVFVRLEVTVVQRSSAGEQTVFDGAVELRGDSAGEADAAADGDFPIGDLVISELGALTPDFDLVRVLIIPNVTFDYEYQAVIGEEFTLEATVRAVGENATDEVGIAAVIGTPTDTLADVLEATQGDQAASKLLTLLARERENPTGELAFPDARPLFPLCGLFGLESLLGVGLLGGWALRRRC